MTLSRYVHTGAAPATGLASGISSSATSFTVLDGTGYPSPTTGQSFVVCIDAGATSEEKILCSARSGTTFTVASGGRGYDGTTAVSHSAGTTNVTHVLSAAEVDDTSDHIYTTTRDDHTQYARTDGTRAFSGAVTMDAGLTVTGTTSGPFLTANPVARLYASTSTTLPGNTTPTQIALATQDFAVGGMTTASSGITVPTTGKYRVASQVFFTAGYPGQVQVSIYVNGSAVRTSQVVLSGGSGTALGAGTVNDLISLTANDVITLYVVNETGSTGFACQASDALTFLSAELVSQ